MYLVTEKHLMRKTLTMIFLLLMHLAACNLRHSLQVKELLHSDTKGWAHDVALEGGNIYVSDRQGGLRIFDQAWRLTRSCTPVKDVISLAPNSGMPILASRFEGLIWLSPTGQVYDRYCTGDGDIANAVQARGDFLFAAYGMHGLVIARMCRNQIVPVSSLPTAGWSHDIRLYQNLALLADWNCGVRVVDIRNPGKPREIAKFPSMATSISLAVKESEGARIVAVAEGHAGISLLSLDSAGRLSLLSRNYMGLNFADPAHPKSGGWVHSVAWAGRYLLAANWKRGLAVLDAADYRNPVLVFELPLNGTALGVKTLLQSDGSYLVFLADGEAGLRIFSLQ
jgi:hypothetical protein